jgi:hypothetical protein
MQRPALLERIPGMVFGSKHRWFVPNGLFGHGESVRAWRLQDGRWLVYRRLEPFGEDGELESGFTLTERMPR